MTHVVEIDQSARTDETNRDTALAFANGISYSILIRSTIKQHCLVALRNRYKSPHQFYLKLFVVSLYILLKDHIKNIDTIIIDIEYDGQSGPIRGMLLNYLHQIVPDYPKDAIIFRSIGKHSSAHFKALGTYQGKQKPDYVVSEEELMKLLIK
jgi:hypothetical protein